MIDKTSKRQMSKEQKILIKNSFYSFLNSYSTFFFSIITSFIMARIITRELWGYLILATSYITIFTLILTFLPPSLGLSISYYIPKYRALNQYTKLKSFTINSIIIRTLFVFLIYFSSLLTFFFLPEIFRINLDEYYDIFLILSPLIITIGLGNVLFEINRALNMFKTVFYLLIIRYVINIGLLFYIFFFSNTVNLSDIALINVISFSIPFLINCLIIFIILKIKLKKTNEDKITFKNSFKDLLIYGSPLSVKNFTDGLIKELRTQLVGYFISSDLVTGYHISMNYNSVSGQLFQSFPTPLSISFTELYTKKRIEEINKIYDTLFHYLIFIVLIVTGILIYFSDFFLIVVYGNSYLKYSIILKLALISLIFNVLGIFFYTMLRASNKVNYAIPISLIVSSISFSLFFMGIVSFGVEQALIGLTAGNFINFLLLGILNYKLFHIKMNILKSLVQYSIFFISLGLTQIFEILFLKEINFIILNKLNLSLFNSIQFLSLLIFLISYLTLNIILKIITKSDIEIVETFLAKETFINKIVRKGLKFLKKIVRK